jgi:hypothetical protein
MPARPAFHEVFIVPDRNGQLQAPRRPDHGQALAAAPRLQPFASQQTPLEQVDGFAHDTSHDAPEQWTLCEQDPIPVQSTVLASASVVTLPEHDAMPEHVTPQLALVQSMLPVHEPIPAHCTSH